MSYFHHDRRELEQLGIDVRIVDRFLFARTESLTWAIRNKIHVGYFFSRVEKRYALYKTRNHVLYSKVKKSPLLENKKDKIPLAHSQTKIQYPPLIAVIVIFL